ncbi:hypothetical protein H920_12731 [Fukomys damarensis]|uniref:Uncharacterized protein n=1 Tax=Fukomys damarensis TaxID=885580 RepID=A0A091D5R4_FUKDA|nr:hypothetical protein H920_12731 [Fukomys damarensis]
MFTDGRADGRAAVTTGASTEPGPLLSREVQRSDREAAEEEPVAIRISPVAKTMPYFLPLGFCKPDCEEAHVMDVGVSSRPGKEELRVLPWQRKVTVKLLSCTVSLQETPVSVLTFGLCGWILGDSTCSCQPTTSPASDSPLGDNRDNREAEADLPTSVLAKLGPGFLPSPGEEETGTGQPQNWADFRQALHRRLLDTQRTVPVPTSQDRRKPGLVISAVNTN